SSPWMPKRPLWNFSGTNEHHLPLQIGDTVHILQASEGEWGNWLHRPQENPLGPLTACETISHTLLEIASFLDLFWPSPPICVGHSGPYPYPLAYLLLPTA
uniref:SH3 domain-containing protein n=1 Tax=Chelonoidis abingdonii TaxID=106734 RepID=A0A8C0G5W4_CHEAB